MGWTSLIFTGSAWAGIGLLFQQIAEFIIGILTGTLGGTPGV